MRTIKFRAWDKERKEMRYEDWKDMCESDCCYCYTQKENVIMFWTGLKDKNRKEIYEGDIVKVFGAFSNDEHSLFKVYYDNGCFRCKLIGNDKDNHTGLPDDDILSMFDDCKIIGNIYEDSKLLEVKQ